MKRQPAKNFQDLIVWQKAHQLVLSVYRYSELFPKNELYGLTSQLRRAAVSIPGNISEGFKKRTKPDKARYLNIAQGSSEQIIGGIPLFYSDFCLLTSGFCLQSIHLS